MTTTEAVSIRRGVSQSLDPAVAARELHESISQANTALGVFYCSPEYDLVALGTELKRNFGDVELIGCTTAGEITPIGYVSRSITGVTISGRELVASTHRIDRVSEFEFANGSAIAQSLRASLQSKVPAGDEWNSLAFLLIDGLSMMEESVVAGLHLNLGDVPLFGGSAGDGVRFEETFVYHDGEFRRDCAVITLMSTCLPFHVFKAQHFVPTDTKMVVTGADPARRIVTEINGRPAGAEYARIIGLDSAELTPMIFGSHPVVVQIGGEYFVRSIQQVNEDGSLSFFCAIDEGIVLTLGEHVDMVENLTDLFRDIRAQVGPPQLVIACDCILRNLESDQHEIKERIGQILADNNTIGFSTYGEQFNAMHVNQTFTGVALGAPVR